MITISQDKAAEESFRSVLEHGPRIELDHYLVYYTRTFLLMFRSRPHLLFLPFNELIYFMSDYELGRLLACQSNIESAKHEFELVLSGKSPEVAASGRKGKYGMEVGQTTFKLCSSR